MRTTLQKTNFSVLSLFCSVNFDKNRINIAEWELSENFLTLYLEDKEDFKEDLADTVMYKLPISKFAEIITANELNSYAGTKYYKNGDAYEARIIINEPMKWFYEDATTYERDYALEIVKGCILKTSLID